MGPLLATTTRTSRQIFEDSSDRHRRKNGLLTEFKNIVRRKLNFLENEIFVETQQRIKFEDRRGGGFAH